jgi:hypothetical protein
VRASHLLLSRCHVWFPCYIAIVVHRIHLSAAQQFTEVFFLSYCNWIIQMSTCGRTALLLWHVPKISTLDHFVFVPRFSKTCIYNTTWPNFLHSFVVLYSLWTLALFKMWTNCTCWGPTFRFSLVPVKLTELSRAWDLSFGCLFWMINLQGTNKKSRTRDGNQLRWGAGGWVRWREK